MSIAPTIDPDLAPPDTFDADPLHHALCRCMNPTGRKVNKAACGATGLPEDVKPTQPPPKPSRCIVCADLAGKHLMARWAPLREVEPS